MTKPPAADDVLLIWNRYGEWEALAKKYESAGARVLVVENGYFGADEHGERLYAISKREHHHGGAPITDRGFASQPYSKGKHILVCGQRGIGSQLMASPAGWAEQVAEKIQAITDRPVKVRPHPGKNAPRVSLEEDLQNCHCCIVWSSACGVAALRAGIPVLYDAPTWIAKESAIPLQDIISKNLTLENLPYMPQAIGLNTAASNQYDLATVRSGGPFWELLR